MSELPQGWEWAKLEDILFVLSGEAFKKKDYSTSGIKLLQIANVSFGKIIWEQKIFLPEEFLYKYPELTLEKDDIVMALNRPILNGLLKIACLEEDDVPAILYQRVAKFKLVFDKTKKYFFYYALSPSFIQLIRDNLQGTDQPYINTSSLPTLPVPIAPLNEQRRIVTKLEKLLTKCEACKQRLDKIPSILKRFRQSILAAACSGRLTADWREQNPDVEPASELVKQIQIERKVQYQKDCEQARQEGKRKPKAPKDIESIPLIGSHHENLPLNWCSTSIGNVADCLDYLRVPVNKDERAKRLGSIPYYGANGQVGWIDDFIFDEDLVVVVEDETFIGRDKPFSYIIKGKSWVNNHAHILRPLGLISVEYLNICLSYYDFVPLTSGTTGRRKLVQSALLEAEFFLAPIAEQKEIVQRVEKLFKLADQIEQRYQTAKAHIDKLPQSILAKAFRGELVSQDPADEPAAVLLERIRVEREQREKGERGKGKGSGSKRKSK